MPICLPKFNDRGFVHAYVSYVTPSYPGPASDLCLVLVSPNRDAFFDLSDSKRLIVEVQHSETLLDAYPLKLPMIASITIRCALSTPRGDSEVRH
jgi:hypothetical protein